MALLMFPPPADTVVDVRSALTTQVAYPEGSPLSSYQRQSGHFQRARPG